MERQRSPSYPSLSLEQAIEMVGKIHKVNRTNVISRETAARDMGYAGLTGRSMTVLGSLAQYGLMEKAGKGDVKVTRRAVEILHPVEEAHRAEAIVEAAQTPALFKTLHERFPDGVPSENALKSFMVQNDFNDVAIGPAIAAFLETIEFAGKAREGGGSGRGSVETTESPPQPIKEQGVLEPVVAQVLPNSFGDLNKISMNINGDQVAISGLFDLKGLRLLEKRISSLKALMAPDDEDEHDGEQ